MKTSTILTLLTAVVAIFLLLAPMRIKIGSEDMTTLNAATEAFSNFMSNPGKRIPDSVLEGAFAIAVIPRALRGPMPSGSGFGQGIMVVRSKDGTWSGPSFVLLNETSSGTNQENHTTDAFLVINSKQSIEALVYNGSLSLGEHTSMSSGPVGNTTWLSLRPLRNTAVYSYFHDNKRPAPYRLESGVLNIDNDLNSEFYSRKGITLNEIIEKEGVRVPSVAKRFTCLVSTYTEEGNKCS